MPDITEYLYFGFFYYVVFKKNIIFAPPELVIWIDAFHIFGKLITYWVIPNLGIRISCCAFHKLTNQNK